MSRRWLVIGPLTVVLMLAASIAAQRQIDAIRDPNALHENLLYLPNERLLSNFTAGLGSVVADLLWIKCVQYTAIHFKTDRKFEWLNHMCTMVTQLDPYFVPVYRYGAIFLAALEADDNASVALLERGIAANPDSWELPYEMAMIYLLNRRDWPGSEQLAAAYLGMAVKTGKAPSFVVDVAHRLQEKADLVDIERDMWQAIVDSSEDQLMRDLAAGKLVALEVRQTRKQLNQVADEFERRYGKRPAKLEDLVDCGALTFIPEEQLGGRFYIDDAGHVQSSSLIAEKTDELRTLLEEAVAQYKKKQGALPESLDDLLRAHVLVEMPGHPDVSKTWRYDPATGAVSSAPRTDS